MLANSCRPEEIFKLNNEKEYTLISTALLEKILTDIRLNAQTVKLWQLLFNKAKYKNNLSTKLSYCYLAKILNKSVRTILRYSKTLVEAGYIIIEKNFDESGGQRSNTFLIRVPEALIQEVQQEKNRGSKTSNTVHENKRVESSSITIQEAEIKCQQDDIFVMGEGDTSVTHNNSFKDYNNKNNKNVVVSFDEKNNIPDPEIEIIQKNISVLENSIHPLEEKIKQEWNCFIEISSNDVSNSYSQRQKIRQLEAYLDSVKVDLEKEKMRLNSFNRKNESVIPLNEDKEYFLQKEGSRKISSYCFKRLVKSLEKQGFNNFSLNRITNEIVYETRFGSLIRNNKNQQELNVENAINIALKLVKEGRWNMPNALKQYCS